jgi:hypothetical protein
MGTTYSHPPHLQGHTLHFWDGAMHETQHFYPHNMMKIMAGSQQVLGTYSCAPTRDGLTYHYIPIGKSGMVTGHLHARHSQLRLDLTSQQRQLRHVPCSLH